MDTIVFTDLDGTFLNHDNYSFSESEAARLRLHQKKIPLIFTTSKTKVEVEQLQQAVGIKEPFIVENGAALFIPNQYQGLDFPFLNTSENYAVLPLGVPYSEIVTFYNTYKSEFKMYGFSDMTDEEVVHHTGLSLEKAKFSKQRDFTEPILLEDETVLPALTQKALAYGFKITKGGRFYHIIGMHQDKGRAVKKCVEIFEKLYKIPIVSIGLGDGENDIPLLENVDVPIAIQNHAGNYIRLTTNQEQKSSFKGAKGWNEMILKNV